MPVKGSNKLREMLHRQMVSVDAAFLNTVTNIYKFNRILIMIVI